ncbi:DUF6090 family protein [Lutimonas sp.]|uniref:DUF6090 family protein n=1 Tax=Lutimonas sp. TaxID=1872403 RepID=UPI003C784069
MADNNKPMMYMRYAIGEIVLVVIGILIALQINNWNEERKTRIEERDLLLELRRDLNLNLIQLNHYKNLSTTRMQKIPLYWNYFQNRKGAIDNDSLGNFILNMGNGEVYVSEFNSLYSILTTSRIELIENEELRYYMNRLSAASKGLKGVDDQRVALVSEKVDPEISKYFYLGSIYNYMRNPDQIDEKLYTDSVDDFFTKIEYQNLVTKYFGIVSAGFYTSDWVIGILKDTQLIIDEELQKYDNIDINSFYSQINLKGTAIPEKDGSIPLQSLNKENTLWKVSAKLQEGYVRFINRNSYTIIWSGTSFPKGEFSDEYDVFIPVTKGTYTVLLDLENKTYEFIKQDD